MKELLEQARSLNGELVRWRRHIHENPEVGADLPDTCAYVTEELRKMGYEPYLVGGGVVADEIMKALNIQEVEICPWALREGAILRWLDQFGRTRLGF